MIMEDAKRKKVVWKERLREMAVESQWILRETLVIKGAAYMMTLEDNRKNAAQCKKLVGVWVREGCEGWGWEKSE